MLRVRQTLVKIGSKYLFQKTAKSKKGLRIVAISPDVKEVLEQHREEQEAEREFLGELWPNNDLVFVSEVGTHLSSDNLRRLRNRLMDKAEVPRVKLHELKHLHSSFCIKNGMDPTTLADRLGHSRTSFTVDTYVYLFEEQRVKSAVSLLDFLPKKDRRKAKKELKKAPRRDKKSK